MKPLGILAALALLLTGCAPERPTHREVEDRFAIELHAGFGSSADVSKLAGLLTDDAFAGKCGDDKYTYSVIGQQDQAVHVAWAATCGMYFEHDMSPEQQEAARAVVGRDAVRRSTP